MPNLSVQEFEKAKIKDNDSNQIFERKAIYELKK